MDSATGDSCCGKDRKSHPRACPRADYREWRELLDAAEVRAARLHDSRHPAATMLLVLRVPVRAVMDIMGWSEASMASRYMHVPDGGAD